MQSKDAACRHAVGLLSGEDGFDRLGDLVDRKTETERNDRRRLGEADVPELLRGHTRVEFLARESRSDLGPQGTAALGGVDDPRDPHRIDADTG